MLQRRQLAQDPHPEVVMAAWFSDCRARILSYAKLVGWEEHGAGDGAGAVEFRVR